RPGEALFASGQALLGPPGKKVLDAVARELRRMEPRRLLVAAHSDDRPTPFKGGTGALTLERARRVAEYFAKMGVPPQALATAGFAGIDPVADNGSDEGRTRNRRLEIQLLDPLPPPPRRAP